MASAQHTAAYLYANDEQLKNLDRKKYATLASDEVIEKFKTAAEAKQWKVDVVGTKEEALKAIVAAIPDGATVTSTGSIGLEQIGYTTFAKENPSKWNNLKAQILAAGSDFAKAAPLYAAANNAQYVVTTATAVTESGDFLTADLSGTRVGPVVGGQKLIVLVGAQKIVKDLAAAHDRLENYSLPLESARVRIVYKFPASAVAFTAEVRVPSPIAPPGRVHYVVVKEEVGY